LIPSLTFGGHPFMPGLQGLGIALAFLANLSKESKSLGSIDGIMPPFFLQ